VSQAPSSPIVKKGDEIVVIGAREAQRLRERFLTRATAVFYARMALLALGLMVMVVPSWKRAFAMGGIAPWIVFACGIGWSIACQSFAAHPNQGRRVMFATLLLDLGVLFALIARSGGLASPAMGVQLLYTIFFALLFPNPIAILPPLLILPAALLGTQLQPVPPPLTAEVMRIAWLAALNGVAVYVMVYLTSREEKQNREILELEQSLKNMAIVEERNRIARDIHDGLGASLSGVIIQAEYLLTLTKKDEDLQSEVKELKTGAEEAIDEVRRAVSMWRDDFQLVPQLENMCMTFTSRHKIPVELKIEGHAVSLAEQQELGIFRILQECLTNIAKHAVAKKVTVQVGFEPEMIRLRIVDDGKGFDPSKTPKNHYGLINMRERARKAGGEVSINSSPGQGTQVELLVKPQLPAPRLEVPAPA
jgi:two-component system, NarL family, sensor histidine kinase DegS